MKAQKFDPHLRALLQQTKYNSFGFFFVSFIIPVVAYLDFEANGYEMGLLFSLHKWCE